MEKAKNVTGGCLGLIPQAQKRSKAQNERLHSGPRRSADILRKFTSASQKAPLHRKSSKRAWWVSVVESAASETFKDPKQTSAFRLGKFRGHFANSADIGTHRHTW